MRQLEASWQELLDVVESLPETEMRAPGVVGDWSVKDLLGHIAFWSERAARNLNLIAAGRNDELTGPEDEQALNEWNAREAKAREDKSIADVREEWLRDFEAAREALAVFPEEKLDMPLRDNTVLFSFGADTFAHYKEHVQQIRDWVKQLETTEG